MIFVAHEPMACIDVSIWYHTDIGTCCTTGSTKADAFFDNFFSIIKQRNTNARRNLLARGPDQFQLRKDGSRDISSVFAIEKIFDGKTDHDVFKSLASTKNNRVSKR